MSGSARVWRPSGLCVFLTALDRVAQSTQGRVAAVVAEPVIGAAGVYPASREYLRALRERCDRWGAYLVLDEVICGFGRLGQWCGPSYSGHPTAAAAALANLDILESERLLERAARLGERLGKGLASLVDGEHDLEARGTPGIRALRTAAHLDAPPSMRR
jgi:putrescine---pyruvate transaminase